VVGTVTRGIARAGFDADLAFGKARERRFREVLDLRAGHHLELKADQRAASTGNIFVEYRQHGRQSGIAITDCTWWTTEVVADVFVTQRTERLKELARRAYRDPGNRRAGGDYNAYDGILVPVFWLVVQHEFEQPAELDVLDDQEPLW
jgi:hypothetical protein